MEVAIIKRETTGSGPNTFHDNETIAKYEIMDGAPVKGESIPIRVFLAGYDLTPTMRDINKKFSVKYYLNLVLVDEEERRYFKQQEITLWRKSDRPRKLMPGGYPGAMHGAYQVPHALARHNPGDRPTHNVRTAPTPTTEEPSYVPGISQSSQIGHDSQSLTGQSPEDQVQIPGGQLYRNQEERLPIPEEDEEGEDVEQISSNREEKVTQNKEQIPVESEKHSEPLDESFTQEKEQLQEVTESIANMNTEEAKSVTATSETRSQNETGKYESKEEQPIITPPTVSTLTINTKDANSTSDKN